jgi:hypothetical protein
MLVTEVCGHKSIRVIIFVRGQPDLCLLDGFYFRAANRKFHEMRSAGTELFHVDGWTDGRTDMKLIVAFCYFANAPKSKYLLPNTTQFSSRRRSNYSLLSVNLESDAVTSYSNLFRKFCVITSFLCNPF